MKFSLFVHMERYQPTASHRRLFEELEELVLIAEAAGFETAWIGEHHAMEFTIAPNPFINLAYLAAKTERIRLGTGTVIAPFWHPIKLAGEAAMMDVACNGRLDVGIARGAYTFEYERLLPGLDAWGAGQRLRELVPAVKRLWQGDYAHQGEFWSFPTTTAVPTPLQTPHPPIWIAARDPNSHEFAVLNGCNVQVTPLASGDGEVANLAGKFDAACAAHPEIARPRLMLLMHAFCCGSQREVEDVSVAMSRYYNYFGAWWKNERPIHQGFIEELSEAELAANAHYAPEAIRRNLLIEQPDGMIRRLRHYADLGYDQFSIWIDSLLPHAHKRATLERFVRDVMPAFA